MELSNEFELRQKTYCTFKQKVQQVKKSSLKSPLTGLVHAYQFVRGGSEKGKRGRSSGAKKLIVLALEIVEDGVGRAYAEVIENSSTKELGSFLMKYVSKDAELISDKWKGYTPLKKEFTKLKQVASDEGKILRIAYSYNEYQRLVKRNSSSLQQRT